MMIDSKLAALARQMNRMASTDMGDLSKDEANLFHTACDTVNQLMESRDHRWRRSPRPSWRDNSEPNRQ
jgi:hypothetical protein